MTAREANSVKKPQREFGDHHGSNNPVKRDLLMYTGNMTSTKGACLGDNGRAVRVYRFYWDLCIVGERMIRDGSRGCGSGICLESNIQSCLKTAESTTLNYLQKILRVQRFFIRRCLVGYFKTLVMTTVPSTTADLMAASTAPR